MDDAELKQEINENNYMDVWPALHGTINDPGHTMREFLKFKGWRPDRIFLQKNAKFLAPKEIIIIG